MFLLGAHFISSIAEDSWRVINF